MVNIIINMYLLFLIISGLISFSNTQISVENELQNTTIRLALNGQNLYDIEKIIVSKFLSGREIPLSPIELSQNISFIGNINLTLNNIIIKLQNILNADISFIKENTLNIFLNTFQGNISFDYYFNSNFISSKGNGNILIKNISLEIYNDIIQVENELEPDKKIPGIKINNISIMDFELVFIFSKNGTFEKLIKYFYKNLKNYLIKALEIELNKNNTINNINNQLLTVLQKLNLNVPITLKDIDDDLRLSFSINDQPLINNNYIELAIKGEIKGNNYNYDQINNINLPCIINNTELISDKSINTIISEFIFNNAIDLFDFFGKLNINITNDTIGMDEINVGVLSLIIDEIREYYSSSQKVKIITKTLSSPILELNDNNILNLTLNENLSFFIYDKSNNLNEENGTIPIVADCDIGINAEFNINGKDIQLIIKSIYMINFKVTKSLIGEINEVQVISRFSSFSSLILSQINDNLKAYIENIKNFIINVEGIDFSDIFARSYENYIKVDISPVLITLFHSYLF